MTQLLYSLSLFAYHQPTMTVSELMGHLSSGAFWKSYEQYRGELRRTPLPPRLLHFCVSAAPMGSVWSSLSAF